MPRQKKEKLKQRPDGRYRCVYKGQVFYSRISSDDAIAQREEYKRKLEADEYRKENPTVRDYAEAWLTAARAKIREKSKVINKIHLRHLCSVLGDMYIKDVRPSDILKVYTEKYLNSSDGYIRHARALYAALFSAAVDDGIIRSNPVKAPSAQPHAGTAGHHRAITEEERNLIDTVALDLPASIAARLMLYTGMRPQEVKALKAEDIDKDWIHVRRFVHVKGSNAYEVDSIGKTAKAARDVPLFPPAADAVKGRKGYVLTGTNKVITPSSWGNAWDTYKHAMERHLNGMQYRWYGKTKEHKQLLQEGKPLPPWRTFDVVPYDLRSSFVTWCRDNGVEIHVCIEWMGHTDASMIMRIYDDPTARSINEADKLRKKLFSGSDAGSK